jgi:hypothetical protein
MFKLLVDTCVWLDLAKDPKQNALLDVLEDLVKRKRVVLLVPRLVIDEFRRNKVRVARETTQSLSSAFKRVKEAVWTFEHPRRRRRLIERLSDVDVKLPSLGEAAVLAIGRIEHLLDGGRVVDASDAIKARAAQRAVEAKAPFHRNKNSIADAILLEIYTDAVRDRRRGERLAFVTHNKHDFSLVNGDHRKPHADIASLFTKVASMYCVSLADVLRRVDTELMAEHVFFQEWDEEPRTATEIGATIAELPDKVWYNRHKLREQMIDVGRIELVDNEPRPSPGTIRRDIWRGALKAAAKVEKRYGLQSLGPWDDFEWGMLSGKLSALRWVLGDEWDNLDT